ncbi:vWA domain-containing protein [Zhouia amylolytica]|uniref:Aerotolerance regulator N-terminal domain-containing protein n=1 Tax=Zhouia amylolytica AD3 TaxID=1286632 RepID=W2UMM1_9FLAO|nr:BatA and WFA domain-containing protein [Zhouia amylolytica]ETN95395.1 hypothetical protein P278_11170 [Zhouia amylolytica AD3]
MNFKHPDFLWAFLLLVIPIIVHLFQLRKFKKTPFTNVQLLKKISVETRKSSELKKWLILLSRLLTLSFLIVAFTQPFITNKEFIDAETETIIYLDNSYSMQARGENGPLLQRSINELIDHVSENNNVAIFTNDFTLKSVGPSELQARLLNIGYTQNQYDFNEILLKAKSLFSKDSSSIKNLVIISDFQIPDQRVSEFTTTNFNINLIKSQSIIDSNISIDSISLIEDNEGRKQLSTKLSRQGKIDNNIPVSLFNSNNSLIAKTSVSFKDKNSAEAIFDVTNLSGVSGMISITDDGLAYDNNFYFSVNEPEKINILSVNDTDDSFLKKIYTTDEFNYESYQIDKLDYNRLEKQQLIIINQLTPTTSLINTLNNLSKKGINTLFIPNISKPVKESFSGIPSVIFDSLIISSKKITNINFDHPLFNGVFEYPVSNFQYPEVQGYFHITGNFNSVLSLENNEPFLISNKTNYSFTASLDESNSNFKNSPLIVPILYNLGKKSLSQPTLYYTLGAKEDIDFNISLSQDETITIKNDQYNFIPIQENYGQKVRINTANSVSTEGHYGIYTKDEKLQNISFNSNRNESNLEYLNINQLNNITISESIPEFFQDLKSENKVKELWKWFVIFALIFLIIESLILKYFK